jgi:F-type H+-transporting ATPase subunit b
MEKTLHDLGQLLLEAIPTLFLLLVVHFYLKSVFFRPMADVLAKRRAATDGVRESADALRAKASEQMKTIEAQLRQTRDAIYQEQEEARRTWLGDQTAQLEGARKQAHDLIHQSAELLDAESIAAKSQLGGTANVLADEIAGMLLKGTPV